MEITDQHEAKDIFGCIDEPGDFVSELAGEYHDLLWRS